MAVITNGTSGNDTLPDTDDEDYIYGLDGDDLLHGGGADDHLFGGSGSDTLHGDSGDDSLFGEDQNDLLYGGDGGDFLSGGNGEDHLFGGAGQDGLDGDAGNDILDGGLDGDSMAGGPGDDFYYVDDGGDMVFERPEEGTDSVQSPVGFILADNVENLTLTGTDSVAAYGNEIANILVGNGGANQIYAFGGDDRLLGGGGVDTLGGGAGADFMDGQEGGDVYWIDFATDHPMAEISDTGTSGTDTIILAANAPGTLTLFAGDTGIETVGFLEGPYALNLDASAVLNPLTITGNNGANVMVGTGLADTIQSFGNDDTLKGNAGDDFLDAGSGSDVLVGGSGHDILSGGMGADTFRDTAANHDGDRIVDFARGDRIVFTDATMAGFTFSYSDGVLTYSGGSLRLEGLDHATIAASAAPEGGVQIAFASPPIIVSAGPTVPGPVAPPPPSWPVQSSAGEAIKAGTLAPFIDVSTGMPSMLPHETTVYHSARFQLDDPFMIV